MKENIVLTGASGFVGKILLRHLIKLNFNIIIISREKKFEQSDKITYVNIDLLDKNVNFKEIIKSTSIFINCAGEINNENKMYDLHVYFIKRILNQIIEAREHKKRKINWIQLSSVGVYGPPNIANQPREIYEISNSNTNIMSIYEKTKLEADKYILENFPKHNLNFCILRPSQIIGDYMPNESINKLINVIKKKLFFYIGKKGAIRSYVHVEDVARAIILIVKNINGIAKNKIYNISYDSFIEDIVEEIITQNNLNYKPARYSENLIRFLLQFFSIIRIPLPLTMKRLNGLVSRTRYNSSIIKKELSFKFKYNPVYEINNLKR